jgi:SSS family solute:Na+ symporter
MVSGLFIPVTRCFILEKSIPLLLLEYAFGGATTILLIITENKLPLGIKLRTFRRKYLWNKYFALLFVTISIYNNKSKMEFKIINSTSGRQNIYQSNRCSISFHSFRRIW